MLSGDSNNYYDPRNSFINAVLERRRGIPITMCIIWALAARHAGNCCYCHQLHNDRIMIIILNAGISCYLCAGMPQHVIVCVDDNTFVDAFNAGEILDLEAVKRMVGGMGLEWRASFVERGPAHRVYARLVRNLFGIYNRQCTTGDRQAQNQLLGVVMQSVAISSDDDSLDSFRGYAQQLGEDLGRLPIDL